MKKPEDKSKCTCYSCSNFTTDFDYSAIVPRCTPKLNQLIMVKDSGKSWEGPYYFKAFEQVFGNDMIRASARKHQNGVYWRTWRHLTGHEQIAWAHIE